MLAAYRMRGHGSHSAATEALEADFHRQIEHDCHRDAPLLAGDVEQLPPPPILHVRRVDDSQAPTPQPKAQGGVQEGEGVLTGGLVGLVVGHDAAERV